MTDSRGVRSLLFGIAVILLCGFLFVHDAVRYAPGNGPFTFVAFFGLFGGLAICLVGLLRGADAGPEREADARPTRES